MGNGDETGLTVAADDVENRSRDDGFARGEILRCLGRTDEAGRLVQGKGNQSDIPAGEVGRELVVGFAAQVVDVGSLRKRGRIDLDDGTDKDEVNFGFETGCFRDELEVEALIENTVETGARMRDGGLILWIGGGTRGEMRAVDGAWEGVDVCVAIPFCPRRVAARR